MPKIEEQNKSTLEYTMDFGALLGMFWIIKYAFLIGADYWVHFIYFHHLLNVVSPLLMYIFYLKYRSETPELHHDVGRCVIFVVGISFFGSFFESAIIYAHYAYINPDFFAKMSSIPLGLINDMMIPEGLAGEQLTSFNQSKELIAEVFSSKITYLVSNMMGNIFLGLIFSLLIGFLTRNRNVQ